MELATEDLLEFTMHHDSVPEDIVLDLQCQLLFGLSHIHHCGWAHRDIKLENCLIFQERNAAQRLAITDFDFATPLLAEGTAEDGAEDDGLARTPCGTSGYAAPEV